MSGETVKRRTGASNGSDATAKDDSADKKKVDVDKVFPPVPDDRPKILSSFTFQFILVSLLAVSLIFLLPSSPKPSVHRQQTQKLRAEGQDVRVFTPEELAHYDGADESKPVYIAILGQVFDVTKGKNHYSVKSGAAYSFFAGKDASRSFSTGDFSGEHDQPHKVDDLLPAELVTIENWLGFYSSSSKYSFVGVLHRPNDPFSMYDSNGRPTSYHATVQRLIDEGRGLQKQLDEEMDRYPNCNSRWEKDKGAIVWCDNGRIPRRGSPSGQGDEDRCGCYTPSEVATFATNLKVLSGCEATATTCKLEDQYS